MKYIFLIFLCGMISCKEKLLKNEIKEQIGKVIIIDTSKLYIPDSFMRESVYSKSLKLIVYVDSTSCSACQMRLPEWKMKIRELNEFRDIFQIIFIVNSYSYEEIMMNFQAVGLKNTIILFDRVDTFKTINKLSRNSRLHTFLLDQQNQIILIGSPIKNDRMWDMYKKIVKNKLVQH